MLGFGKWHKRVSCRNVSTKRSYKLIEEYTIDRLNAKVNDYIEKGWVPLGSPIVFARNLFYQCVVKLPSTSDPVAGTLQ